MTIAPEIIMDVLIVLYIIVSLGIGIAVGFFIAGKIQHNRYTSAREIAAELLRETESLRHDDREAMVNRIRESFGDLSLEALRKSTDQFYALAKERFDSERHLHTKELDSKKGLIDQQLDRMKSELDKVSTLVGDFEKDREKKFGELTKQLEETGKRTSELIRSTNTLREALASSKSRGQWGERMAEDVLRLAGFIENVNYVKQKSMDGSREIPDFTFFLPRDLRLNMDVKFPFDNYLRFIESDSDSDRETYRKGFLRDVKSRIQEVSSRGYIDPEHNTVDFVLLFIPNEHIYAFIHEQDASIVDDGIKKHVIICSPVTLFSVLAVIRASVENFALEQTSNRILSLLGSFKKQWETFVDKFDKLGRSIDTVRKDYDHIVTTRRNQLEKPLIEIDEIRSQRGIMIAETDDIKMLEENESVDTEDNRE